jgi:hypothetical protein
MTQRAVDVVRDRYTRRLLIIAVVTALVGVPIELQSEGKDSSDGRVAGEGLGNLNKPLLTKRLPLCTIMCRSRLSAAAQGAIACQEHGLS